MPFRALLRELDPDAADAERVAALARDGYQRAASERPELRCAERAFLRVLLTRLARDPEVQDFAEIALVGACADGDAQAVAVFERAYMTAASASLKRLRVSAAESDEVLQRVRLKLLVPERTGELPAIAAYAGSGKLKSFVRVVATREAVSLLRTKRPNEAGSELEGLAASFDDPALKELAQRSREAMKRGFETAVAELSSRDRNILRLHFLDGVELNAIARLYSVHRVTASRWLSDIRESLLEKVRDHVQRELALTDSDVASVVRLAREDLDASVERILRTPTRG